MSTRRPARTAHTHPEGVRRCETCASPVPRTPSRFCERCGEPLGPWPDASTGRRGGRARWVAALSGGLVLAVVAAASMWPGMPPMVNPATDADRGAAVGPGAEGDVEVAREDASVGQRQRAADADGSLLVAASFACQPQGCQAWSRELDGWVIVGSGRGLVALARRIDPAQLSGEQPDAVVAPTSRVEVAVLDAASGRERFRHELDPSVAGDGDHDPQAGPGVDVFFSAYLTLVQKGEGLLALSDDGEERWVRRFPGPAWRTLDVSGGHVVVTLTDDGAPDEEPMPWLDQLQADRTEQVLVLDPADGSTRWQVEAERHAPVAGGILLVVDRHDGRHRVQGRDVTDGEVRWERETDGPSWMVPELTRNRGVLPLVLARTTDGEGEVLLDATTGTVIDEAVGDLVTWTTSPEGWTWLLMDAAGTRGRDELTAQWLDIGRRQDLLVLALDADRQVVWQRALTTSLGGHVRFRSHDERVSLIADQIEGLPGRAGTTAATFDRATGAERPRAGADPGVAEHWTDPAGRQLAWTSEGVAVTLGRRELLVTGAEPWFHGGADGGPLVFTDGQRLLGVRPVAP